MNNPDYSYFRKVQTPATHPDLTLTQSAVIRTLLYFNIFRHPLTAQEVHANLTVKDDIISVQNALMELKNSGLILEEEGYYSTESVSTLIRERQRFNELFHATKQKIQQSTRIISRFPFVRGVAISGSISKGIMKEDGDIDFFIITSRRRLWICRSLLILNKKILRFNNRKYFCVNYFLDEDSMHIPDHNLFTATELAWLIPTYDQEVYEQLMQENEWAESILPNFRREPVVPVVPRRQLAIKYLGELCFPAWFGDKIDRMMMRMTMKQWRKKFPHFTQEEFDLAMRSKRNVSKHHPSNFQVTTLARLDEAIDQFQRTHNLILR